MIVQNVFAVSGVKNSGKTTFIGKLIKVFNRKNLKVAVIKHDGHDFVPDVPDTDSYKLRNAGADGVAVISEKRVMINKNASGITEAELIKEFKDSDIIILEGFKYSDYPKVEIVRKANSQVPVCGTDKLFALVTDLSPEELPEEYRQILLYNLNDEERLAKALMHEFGYK